MTVHSPRPDEQRGHILQFPRRRPARNPPVEDLAKYAQQAGEADDYRHRMKMNALAFAVVALLVVAGTWLAIAIAELRKDQDCVLAGRKGCAPVSSKTINHY